MYYMSHQFGFFFTLKFIENVLLSIVSIVNKEHNDKWMAMYVSVKSYQCSRVYLDGGCTGQQDTQFKS